MLLRRAAGGQGRHVSEGTSPSAAQPCAWALGGACARFSQGKQRCPGEAHITGIPFCLSQALAVSFEQESQCAVTLTADKWVWWCRQFVPSLAKQLDFFFFPWSCVVGVLRRLGE